MKYLIDEDLLGRLKLTCPLVMLRRLESLKPIEPLSAWNIDEIYERIDDYEAPTWMHSFARAIEAHILRERK